MGKIGAAKPTGKVTRHRRYVKSYSGNNNNKFWYITEFEDGSIFVQYGRIGDKEQTCLHDPGEKNFDSLCRSKEKGKKDEPGYRQLDVVDAPQDTGGTSKPINKGRLEDAAVKEIAGGDKTIEELIRYFTKQNIHNILTNTTMTYDKATGLFSTPCGIVTASNINQARDLLAEMVDFVKEGRFNTKYTRLLEDYLMLIPQKVKNMRQVEDVFPDEDAIEKQNGLLDSLQASLDTLETQPTTKKVTTENNVFGVTLKTVADRDLFRKIKRMYEATSHRNHVCSYLKLSAVYEVDITQMRERFERIGVPIGNIKLLWHGTRVANVLSILHKGLIIPPSSATHCTGRAFGNGVYFSDQSTKSLNYSYGYWGHGGRDENCFMFLCDVAMGRMFSPTRTGRDFPKPGYDSTFAEARRSGFANNEMIIYQLGQCNLKYLCKFSR